MTITLEKLLICSTAMSLVAMLLASAALWPHSQEGLRKIRDGGLWFAFIFLLVGIMTVACRQVERYAVHPSSVVTESPFAVRPSPSFAAPSVSPMRWQAPPSADRRGKPWVQPVTSGLQDRRE